MLFFFIALFCSFFCMPTWLVLLLIGGMFVSPACASFVRLTMHHRPLLGLMETAQAALCATVLLDRVRGARDLRAGRLWDVGIAALKEQLASRLDWAGGVPQPRTTHRWAG